MELNLDFYIKDLNEEQLEAVTYSDGPLLVIAGAGSGKTRVLTYKIAYLLHTGVHPRNILSLTFTNKAAKEMNQRIASIVGGEKIKSLWSGTFHSVFSRMLRMESESVGFTHDFSIYDASDTKSLLKSIIKENGLDEKIYKPSLVAGRISEAKNLLILPEQYEGDASLVKRDQTDGVSEIAKIYLEYNRRLRHANAMDFDDLLLNTYLLLKNNDGIRKKYQDRFTCILVDEYQDTNLAQHRIISQLTNSNTLICVVGDDAQSIYGFRGANIDNILYFTNQYPNAKMIKLERNYRSTQCIVNAANSIIKHNSRQIPKRVFSENEQGNPIKLLSAYSDKEESIKVASEIKRLSHSLDYNSIALLYRTNAQSRSFEETFRNLGIPYRVYGGLSFYQRKEIKDVIAYFRLISNLNDEEALKRIINYPLRGIGNTTLNKLILTASDHNTNLWNVLENPIVWGLNFNAGLRGKIQSFCNLILSFRNSLSDLSAYSLAKEIVKKSGIAADIYSDKSVENLSRQQNLEELLNSIKIFETEQLEELGRDFVPLNEYLSQVSLLTDADNDNDDDSRVTLMTVHAAKGLEFDAVFVTGMEEDLFPNLNARYLVKEMEEERRLFYVAVTRAKHFCYLSYAKSRMRFGCIDSCNPSPFLNEIDGCYLERESIGERFVRTDNLSAIRGGAFNRNVKPLSLNKLVNQNPNNENNVLDKSLNNTFKTSSCGSICVGKLVCHERFGVGEVISLEGVADNQKACVNFRNVGKKNLLLKYAKLKVLD